MHPYTFNIIKSTSSTHFSQQLNIQHNKTHIHLIPTLTNELKKAAPTKELLDLSNIKQQSHLPRFLPLLRPRGRYSPELLLRYRFRFSLRAASVKAPERRKNNASADFETRKKFDEKKTPTQESILGHGASDRKVSTCKDAAS